MAEAEAAADAMAAWPAGLAAELPGVVAVATPALQFSDSSSWVTAEPLLFCGGGTMCCCVPVMMQLGHANWSPTVDLTTGVKPAPEIVLWALEYVCPTTFGGVPATAAPLPTRTSAVALIAMALNPKA